MNEERKNTDITEITLDEALKKQKEVEEELRQMGFDSTRIELFLKSNMAQNIIKESYAQLGGNVLKITEEAPARFKRKIKEIAADYTEFEDEFQNDIRYNFKNLIFSQLLYIKEVTRLGEIPPEICEEEFKKILISQNTREAAKEDLEKLCNDMVKMLYGEFLERCMDMADNAVINAFISSGMLNLFGFSVGDENPKN